MRVISHKSTVLYKKPRNFSSYFSTRVGTGTGRMLVQR